MGACGVGRVGWVVGRSVRSMISEVPLRTAVVKLSAGRWVGLAEALMWSRVREPFLPPVGWPRC